MFLIQRVFTACIAILSIIFATGTFAASVKIKDLVEYDGVRGNDLVGYGLVVGLNGTGDGLRNSPFTEEALANLLERLGINVAGEQFRPKNVAAVLVTAQLPAFARAGAQIDVNVSAIGDSKSLRGGTLIMTPLSAADGNIYAVAQGSLIAGGVSVTGEAAEEVKGVPTAAVVPSGARVEREVEFVLSNIQELRIALRNPDFSTAARIEQTINNQFERPIALMLDSGTVQLDVAKSGAKSPAHLIGILENLEVNTAQKARVVVDQRSGTIVLGDDVRVSRVAVSQGNLTLRVEEVPLVVQPNPFTQGGEAIVVPRTNVDIREDPGTGLAMVDETVSLPQLIEGLNALGVSPQGMIDILKAIKAAGALHAEFIVQ